MTLFTDEQITQLVKNGEDPNPDKDHIPVARLKLIGNGASWLVCELNPDDEDTAYGLCDLGHGYAELRSFKISAIETIAEEMEKSLLKRDESFKGQFPISVYFRAACYYFGIVTKESLVKKFQH